MRTQIGHDHRTASLAHSEIEDMFASGELDTSNKPQVKFIGGLRPWIITAVFGHAIPSGDEVNQIYRMMTTA